MIIIKDKCRLQRNFNAPKFLYGSDYKYFLKFALTLEVPMTSYLVFVVH